MRTGEFRALREGVGYSPEWLATLAGVEVDTVLKWDSGVVAPPATVIAYLEKREANIQQKVAWHIEDAIHAQKNRSDTVVVVDGAKILISYRTDDDFWMDYPLAAGAVPAAHVEAEMVRTRSELAKRGIDSVIIYLDTPRYRSWLQENRKPDSPVSKYEWWIENAGRAGAGGARRQSLARRLVERLFRL